MNVRVRCRSGCARDLRLDPTHPSFEADHMGLSYWRDKPNRNTGTIVCDKATGASSVDVKMNLACIDLRLDAMNTWATGKDFFIVGQNPSATFKGRFDGIRAGVPTQVLGELTLKGKTRPMPLAIHQLKCIPHPMLKREELGLGAGKDWGFKKDVGRAFRWRLWRRSEG